MSGILIRKMAPGDLPRVGALLARWNMAPVQPSAAVPNPERTVIADENAFVAEADGALVGVASYFLLDAGRAETASLAVHPDWLGRGIGERLQHARLAEMRERGVRHVRTEADRPETIAWYVRKFGYRVTGTARKKHAFSRVDIDDWTVLELDLAP